MSHYKPYPAYRDSGVEWIGQVPEHWKKMPFKRVASICNGRDYKEVESADGAYPVIGSGGEFARASDFMFDGESVLLGRKGTIDKPLYINGPFWAVDTMFYTKIADDAFPKFVYYSALTIPFGLYSTNTALPSMAGEDLSSHVIAAPEFEEQKAISEGVDRETTRIDALIAKKTRFIELLKEKRHALIDHAVTKGLNPDAPMRGSDVEWLGEIPAHWEVRRMASIFREAIRPGDQSLPILSISIHDGITDEEVAAEDRDRRVSQIEDRTKYMYDDGAQIDDVQDLNVVYEIKEQLDGQGLYEAADLEAFKEARFKTIRDITHAQEPQHKALYTATEGPTRLFNQRLKMLREAISTWEAAFDKAHSQNDQAGMKSADHHRQEHAEQIKTLMAFKAGLGRFCRTYAYVAQLIDFGDPELENFAAFAKLLQKRLSGETPENVDLKGLVLSGFDIKGKEDVPGEEGDAPVLKPIGPGGGGGAGDTPRFLTEIIDKLNHLFGEATPLRDQVAFVNQIASIARENDVVMAQVESNTRDQAMKGTLPGAVQQGVVRALTSHQKLATLVLKSDRQAMSALTDVIYELICNQRNIDLDSTSD